MRTQWVDGVDEGAINNRTAPREGLPVSDVMGPVRVRDDGHVALVLGGVVSQLEHEGDLHGCLEVASEGLG
jgi:hypothetical protein